MRSGGWVDTITGKLYAFTQQASTGTPGVLCIDITGTPVSCGFTALSSDNSVGGWDKLTEAEPWVAGCSAWRLRGPARCCASIRPSAQRVPTRRSARGRRLLPDHPSSEGRIDDHGQDGHENLLLRRADHDRLFGHVAGGHHGNSYTPIAPHTTADGTVDGVCYQLGCLDMTGATTSWVTPYSLGTTGWAIYATIGALAQGRYYYVGNDVLGVECFDYATNARCANFPLHYDNSFGLIYTIRGRSEQPSCMWINSDAPDPSVRCVLRPCRMHGQPGDHPAAVVVRTALHVLHQRQHRRVEDAAAGVVRRHRNAVHRCAHGSYAVGDIVPAGRAERSPSGRRWT